MSQSLPRFRRHEEHEADLSKLVRIIEGGSDVAHAKAANMRGVRRHGFRSPEGDPFRLRGLPAIGHGIPGGMSTESRALLARIENAAL